MSSPAPISTPNINALAVLCAKHIPAPPAPSHTPTPSTKALPDAALDAFAALAVSDPKERFATAIRIDRHRRKAVLYLASNQDASSVRSDTIVHLTDIWRRLKTLAEAYRSNETALLANNSRSNALPVQLELDIMRSVYDFSSAVVKKRFDKWWPVLKWVKRSNGKASELSFANSGRLTQELEFTSMTYHLGTCAQFLDKLVPLPLPHTAHLTHPRDTTFTPFNCNMKAAARIARSVLSAPDFCEHLARKSDPAAPPRIRQAITKLTSLQAHLTTLFDLARTSSSNTGKHVIFSYDLTIEVVDPASTLPEYISSWPTSPMEWHEFEEDISRQYHAQSSTSPPNNDLTPSARSYPFIPTQRTHPACSLIQHLETSSSSSKKPTLKYIGLSHRPCRGCVEWIEAFNEVDKDRVSVGRMPSSTRERHGHGHHSHTRKHAGTSSTSKPASSSSNSTTKPPSPTGPLTSSKPLSITIASPLPSKPASAPSSISLPFIPYTTRPTSSKFTDDFVIPPLSSQHVAPLLASRWAKAICEAREERERVIRAGCACAAAILLEEWDWVGMGMAVEAERTALVGAMGGCVNLMGMEGGVGMSVVA
ncbi:hypothetical protein M422DRAFT_265765 [Sphaerobolus stellatus SS14]|uniref:Uncharacterized protein n=1 Tax=Sphaerobolus stellatus (strain SS14) TaxID=990650 RepID=A0A0C9V4V5_SPHS4|nr:hypothetical protein M422DRAFT_265765 [Sphaerobolus stellatus SS14]